MYGDDADSRTRGVRDNDGLSENSNCTTESSPEALLWIQKQKIFHPHKTLNTIYVLVCQIMLFITSTHSKPKNYVQTILKHHWNIWMSKVNESESDMTWSSMVNPYSELSALHLSHPKCTHSSEHTHTVNTHSEQWAANAEAPGEQFGGSVPCSREPRSWYWRWREHWLFTPPTYNPCRTRDSNSQPLGYESNSLTIRPLLPHKCPNTCC